MKIDVKEALTSSMEDFSAAMFMSMTGVSRRPLEAYTELKAVDGFFKVASTLETCDGEQEGADDPLNCSGVSIPDDERSSDFRFFFALIS